MRKMLYVMSQQGGFQQDFCKVWIPGSNWCKMNPGCSSGGWMHHLNIPNWCVWAGGACGYKQLTGTPYGPRIAAGSRAIFQNGKGCGQCYAVSSSSLPLLPTLFVNASMNVIRLGRVLQRNPSFLSLVSWVRSLLPCEPYGATWVEIKKDEPLLCPSVGRPLPTFLQRY